MEVFLITNYKEINLMEDLVIPHVFKKENYNIGNYSFLNLYSSLNEKINKFNVSTDGEHFYYENGWSLEENKKLILDVSKKKKLFDLPTSDLDGNYIQIKIKDNKINIRKNASSIDNVAYFKINEYIFISNSNEMLEQLLKQSKLYDLLEINKDYYLNNSISENNRLYCGGKYKQLDYVNNLEEYEYDGKNVTKKFVDQININKYKNKYKIDKKGFNEYFLKRLNNAIKEFLEKYKINELSLDITGGRDSRVHVAIFNNILKNKIKLNVIGNENLPDVIIARQVAKELKLPINVLHPNLKSKDINIHEMNKETNKSMNYKSFFLAFNKTQSIYELKKIPDIKITGVLGNVIFNSLQLKGMPKFSNYAFINKENSRTLHNKFMDSINEMDKVVDDEWLSYYFNLRFNNHNRFLNGLSYSAFSLYSLDCFAIYSLILQKENINPEIIQKNILKYYNKNLLINIPFEEQKSFVDINTFEISSVPHKTNKFELNITKARNKKITTFKDEIKVILLKNNDPDFINDDFWQSFHMNNGEQNIRYFILGYLGYLSVTNKITQWETNKAISLSENTKLEPEEKFYERTYVQPSKYTFGIKNIYQKDEVLWGLSYVDHIIATVINIHTKARYNLIIHTIGVKGYYEFKFENTGHYRLNIFNTKTKTYVYSSSTIKIIPKVALINKINSFQYKDYKFKCHQVNDYIEEIKYKDLIWTLKLNRNHFDYTFYFENNDLQIIKFWYKQDIEYSISKVKSFTIFLKDKSTNKITQMNYKKERGTDD